LFWVQAVQQDRQALDAKAEAVEGAVPVVLSPPLVVNNACPAAQGPRPRRLVSREEAEVQDVVGMVGTLRRLAVVVGLAVVVVGVAGLRSAGVGLCLVECSPTGCTVGW
jgi:hypothetical protein